MAGDPIDQSFFASGGTLPYTWTTTLNLPEGLTLSPAGRLTGTLRLPGNYELRLRATDFYGCKADITVMQEVTIEVPTQLTPTQKELIAKLAERNKSAAANGTKS